MFDFLGAHRLEIFAAVMEFVRLLDLFLLIIILDNVNNVRRYPVRRRLVVRLACLY